MNKNLSVATLCSLDHGGAGTGTQRRVEALRQNDVNAHIFSLIVKSNHTYVQRLTPSFSDVDASVQANVWKEVRARAIAPVTKIKGYCAKELFSLPVGVLSSNDFSSQLGTFNIIHFHWVVGMLDYNVSNNYFKNKALVWTLADMNAFTGGCHYSEGCSEYKQECKNCPLLGGNSNQPHEAWKKKKTFYQSLNNLHIICPSKKMKEFVKNSSLLGDRTIHYIPNAFLIDRLKSTNKMVARIKLGLPLNKKLLLFGADNLTSYRKGKGLLEEVFKIYTANGNVLNFELITFGDGDVVLPVFTHALGFIQNDELLSLVYSAADAFIFPSREDNAPLTVGESLLCGTPVISFNVGNIPEVVQHKKNGYIAENFCPKDFLAGIEWAINTNEESRLKRSIQCSLLAQAFHDPQLSAERHKNVYAEVLSHQ